jgi:uncharacterized membrane protein YfcA
MDLFTVSNDSGTLALGLLIAGAAAGLISGVLGRGGVLLLVPALFLAAHALGIAPGLAFPLAAGTALAAMLPVTAMALADTTKQLDRGAVLKWALPAAAAIGVGAVVALRLPGVLAVEAYGVLALVLAALTARGNGCGATGAFFGAVTALAGTIIAVAAGWNMRGLPPHSYGYVNGLAVAIIAPVALATARVAARYACEIESKRTRILLAAVIALSTAKMVWVAVG